MLKTVRCPTCRQLAPWAGNPHRPFCCERCKLRDLGNWATERYRVPGGPADQLPDETTPPGDDDPQ